MKVIMLCKYPIDSLTGGVAVHTVNLVKELGKIKDLDLHVISFSNKSEVKFEGRSTIILINARKIYHYFPFLALIRLFLEIRKIEPDILHIQGSNLSPYLIYSLFLAKNTKKIVTIHSYPKRELVINNKIKKNSVRYKFIDWMEKYTLKKIDYFITVDTRLKNWIVEGMDETLGKNKSDNVSVILNGVNLDEFDYNLNMTFLKNKLKISKNDNVIFNAKAFVPKNGQEYLIKSIPYIISKKPNIKLILAGDGSNKENLIKLSKNLKVSDNILFVGDIPNNEIPSYMALSDVIVVPSIHVNGLEEASSILLVEAMSMKKPVIATDIGGLKESIINRKTGILVPDKNPEKIAFSVLELFNDPSFADYLAENAYLYVKKGRSWSKVAEKTFNIYKGLF